MASPDQSHRSSAHAHPYHLTIRFSSLFPDLDLDIPNPQITTIFSLKKIIRKRLSTRSRLRFIYQGRLLPESVALGALIKPPVAPPPRATSSQQTTSSSSLQPSSSAISTWKHDPKGKGKGKAVEDVPEAVRIYVNCSIGDELSAQELADEDSAAERPPDDPNGTRGGKAGTQGNGSSSLGSSSWTRPRPRGFDRLLQAGFTPSEIATLRTQFASIHTERFAPDAMPSPDTMRTMEDAWIDTNAGELPSAANIPLEDDFSSMSSVLDVLIRGTMVGFFFPLGSLTWLLRSDIWSEKWQIFVGSGVALSLTVGVVMSMSGTR